MLIRGEHAARVPARGPRVGRHLLHFAARDEAATAAPRGAVHVGAQAAVGEASLAEAADGAVQQRQQRCREEQQERVVSRDEDEQGPAPNKREEKDVAAEAPRDERGA